MGDTDSQSSVDLQKLRGEAEVLISQLQDLAGALASYQPPEDAPLKVGQLREISKTITNLENMKIPVPDELRSLKTSLLWQTHEFAEMENISAMLEQELTKFLAKIRENAGVIIVNGERRPRRSGDFTPHSVLRECVVKSLKAHGGRAKTTTVLDEVGEMLKGNLTPNDLDLDDYNKQPIWRRNTCLQRRVMVRYGLVEDETDGGFWELTAQFAATLNK